MSGAVSETSRASAWRTIRRVSPYLWPADDREARVRVTLAMLALLAGKAATVVTPVFFKAAVDALAPTGGAAKTAWLVAAGPVALTLFYGVMRLAGVGFAQLRDGVFASVGQRALRKLALEAFRHIHALSLRYHITRRTGGLSRVHRARRQGRGFPAALPALLAVPAGAGAAAGLRHPLLRLRRLVSRRGGGDDRALRLVHLPADRGAGRDPAADERPRHRGEPEGGRQPAELRDGEVLHRRGARGRALRRLDAGLREGGGRDGGEPELAQPRADADHHRRAGRR